MILYFSGTGNTKFCAEIVSRNLNEKVISINLNLKNKIYEIDMAEENTLGIFAPTYDYDMAWVVKEYLAKTNFKNMSKNLYTYGIFTCGGNNSGICADSLNKFFKTKGLELNYNVTVPMPDNYILLYKLDTSNNDEKIKNAKKMLEEISDNIKQRKTNSIKKSFGAKIFAKASKAIIKSQKDTKKFEVTDQCSGCNLCSKACPLNIIEMKDGKPVWKDEECSCCLSCINRCPKRAITKGKMSISNEHYYNEQVKPDMVDTLEN